MAPEKGERIRGSVLGSHISPNQAHSFIVGVVIESLREKTTWGATLTDRDIAETAADVICREFHLGVGSDA